MILSKSNKKKYLKFKKNPSKNELRRQLFLFIEDSTSITFIKKDIESNWELTVKNYKSKEDWDYAKRNTIGFWINMFEELWNGRSIPMNLIGERLRANNEKRFIEKIDDLQKSGYPRLKIFI